MKSEKLFLSDRNIKMQNILPASERLIQKDCRFIFPVSLHINHPGIQVLYSLFQFLNQSSRNAFSPVIRMNSQIINIHLASFLFKFFQNIGSKSAHNSVLKNSTDKDDMRLLQKPFQIFRRCLFVEIGFWFFKCLAEHLNQLPKNFGLTFSEMKEFIGGMESFLMWCRHNSHSKIRTDLFKSKSSACLSFQGSSPN